MNQADRDKVQPQDQDRELAAYIFLEIKQFLFPDAVYVPGSSGEQFLAQELARVRREGFEEGSAALEAAQTRIAELEKLTHRPIGTGFLVLSPNVTAAQGVTSFLGQQTIEYIRCSCGAFYPKSQEHDHIKGEDE